MQDVKLVYAQSDQDVILMHRFICHVAQPVLLAPIDPIKSINEIYRVVKDPSAGFAIMAIHEDRLVGVLGIITVDFWYSQQSFLTDRFFFLIEAARNHGVGKLMEEEAIKVAHALDVKLLINGKWHRKGAVYRTLPRLHAPA